MLTIIRAGAAFLLLGRVAVAAEAVPAAIRLDGAVAHPGPLDPGSVARLARHVVPASASPVAASPVKVPAPGDDRQGVLLLDVLRQAGPLV